MASVNWMTSSLFKACLFYLIETVIAVSLIEYSVKNLATERKLAYPSLGAY